MWDVIRALFGCGRRSAVAAPNVHGGVVRGFQAHDPEEFFVPVTMLDRMLHHEAGHLLVAYHYGFDIGGFRYVLKHGVLTGAVRNRPSAAVNALGVGTATRLDAQMMLAGEIAQRLRCGLPTNRRVLSLDAPDPATVTVATPIDALHPSEEGRGQDTYNVIATFVHKHIEGNWWEWIWACHDAAEQIVRDNWEHVHQLAVRMAAIPPYANAHQQAAGAPSGDASGQALVNWCQEIGVPIHHPDRVSAAYIP